MEIVQNKNESCNLSCIFDKSLNIENKLPRDSYKLVIPAADSIITRKVQTSLKSQIHSNYDSPLMSPTGSPSRRRAMVNQKFSHHNLKTLKTRQSYHRSKETKTEVKKNFSLENNKISFS